MNVSTRHELQTLLEKIRASQTSPEASPLAYRVAWIVLILAVPLIGLWIMPPMQGSFSGFPLIIFLWFFAQALYTVIQHNVNKRLRPILEALLFVPEEPLKPPDLTVQRPKRSHSARPTRRKRK